MAQRLIHYLLGEMLSKEIELKNKERFLLGSVMPDAYKELKYRDKTHFANRTDGTYFGTIWQGTFLIKLMEKQFLLLRKCWINL